MKKRIRRNKPLQESLREDQALMENKIHFNEKKPHAFTELKLLSSKENKSMGENK